MTQPCPRQAAEGVMPSQLAHHSQWRADGTCSYCGSISPKKLFEAIDAGCKIGPTDKNYKIYVDLIEPEPDALKIVGSSNFEMDPERIACGGWMRVDSDEFRVTGLEPYSEDVIWVMVQPRGPSKFGKFYFQHFTDADKTRFIDLLNAQKINLGEPGYFYRLPFFIQRGEAAA